MNKNPLLSVIMSVYNGEEYLKEAIDSVINQTFLNWELLVVNDCSTDSTGDMLADYEKKDARVKVITNETNLRLPSSLNKALTFAKGKYVLRMDADDICLPDRFSKQYDFMEKNPDVHLSSCRFMTLKDGVISSGGCGGRCDNDSVKALLLVTNPLLHPGIIAKAETIKALKYNPVHTCTEDYELWTRFALGGYKIEILPEYLMIYRLHNKQITQTTLDKQYNEVSEIQKGYMAKLLAPMTKDQEDFYVNGIYFRKLKDINKFKEYCKWLKMNNKKTKAFSKDTLCYAMFEILAEYKRKGLSGINLLKIMMTFDIGFLIKELLIRKKRAARDGVKCIEAAKTVGLVKSGGSLEYPCFSKI